MLRSMHSVSIPRQADQFALFLKQGKYRKVLSPDYSEAEAAKRMKDSRFSTILPEGLQARPLQTRPVYTIKSLHPAVFVKTQDVSFPLLCACIQQCQDPKPF